MARAAAKQLVMPGVEETAKPRARRKPAEKRQERAPRVRRRRDPLLAALLGKLPGPGVAWSAADRVAWLRMASIAFDVAYGPADMPGEHNYIPAIGHAPKPDYLSSAAYHQAEQSASSIELPTGDEEFRIDPDGFAMRGNVAVMPEEVAACGGVIVDYRSSSERFDLSTVLWAKSGARAPETLPPLNVVVGIRKKATEKAQA